MARHVFSLSNILLYSSFLLSFILKSTLTCSAFCKTFCLSKLNTHSANYSRTFTTIYFEFSCFILILCISWIENTFWGLSLFTVSLAPWLRSFILSESAGTTSGKLLFPLFTPFYLMKILLNLCFQLQIWG